MINKSLPTRFTNYSGEELTRVVSALLREIGVPFKMKGFHYLERAVEIVYDSPKSIENVVAGLYRSIADEYGTTPSCVERDMRTAIKSAVANGNIAALDEYYAHFSPKLSARLFIATLADKLRCDMIRPSEEWNI